MRFTWISYSTEYEEVVDSWLDNDAKRFTGIESSFNEFYDYWVNDTNTKVNENLWVKLIFEDNNPIVIIAVALCEGEFNIMEFIISPDKRGKGIGPEILKELLASGKSIIGAEILNAIAVIFPDNIQSQ